jgi:chromosome partitioning protein
MAKIIAVANRKGGVGKTTTALCLAHFLGRRDRSTLLVDLDPQNALSAALAPAGEKSLSGAIDILRGKTDLKRAILRTRLVNVDLLPYGCPESFWDEHDALFAAQNKRSRFAASLSNLGKQYGYILIDSPPGSSAVVQFALFLAESVIIPLQCQPLALRIVPRILNDIKQIMETVNPRLKIEGVLLTMFEFYDPISQSIAEQVWSFFPKKSTFHAVIRRSPVFEKVFTVEDNPLFGEDLAGELLDYDVIAQLVLSGEKAKPSPNRSSAPPKKG